MSTVFTCQHCGEHIRVRGRGLHFDSGNILECEFCGKETIIDLFTKEERTTLYDKSLDRYVENNFSMFSPEARELHKKTLTSMKVLQETVRRYKGCKHQPIVNEDKTGDEGYWVECYECGAILSKSYANSDLPYIFIEGYKKALGLE